MYMYVCIPYIQYILNLIVLLHPQDGYFPVKDGLLFLCFQVVNGRSGIDLITIHKVF